MKVLLQALILCVLFGCQHNSRNYKRELLQDMYPACEVSEELDILCPEDLM